MNNIAIIPARGGSKRIPLKNIKEFNGKPLVAYSIEAALKSHLFSHVIVSTDDEQIAEVAKKCGAEVPFLRDKTLADDFIGTFAVTKDAFYKAQDFYHEQFDNACCIYATAPLLLPKHLIAGFDKLQETHADSCISVCEFPFPIQRAFIVDDKGLLSYREPENAPKRSQDLEPCYQDCGLFYFYNKNIFEVQGSKTTFYEMPRHRVIDIDTPKDWDYACALYRTVDDLKLD